MMVVLMATSCTLFDKDKRLLAKHEKSTGEKIEIYYVSLGATTNDVIDVEVSNQNSIVWASDKYNYLKTTKLINDAILQMVLSDTGLNNYNNKFDTIIVKL